MIGKLISSLLLVTVVLTGLSCSKNNNSTNNDSISSVITQGNWKVQQYLNETKDETTTYNPYVFTFNSNGSMYAVNGTDTTSGTWTEVLDSNKRKFMLKWNGGGIPVLLLQIEEDWVLTSKSTTMIQLMDQSLNNNDVLNFQKQ